MIFSSGLSVFFANGRVGDKKLGGQSPGATGFSSVTLQFLVVFGPVRLAPPQGTRLVPHNTALNHSVCLPSLQHVEPVPQEGQVLFLGAHVFFSSSFFGLHLRPKRALAACRHGLVAQVPQGEG